MVVCSLWLSAVVVLVHSQWLVHGDSQYYYSENGRDYTYEEARSRCAELGATLASVSTEQEHTFLVSHMTRSVLKQSATLLILDVENLSKCLLNSKNIASFNGILKHTT